MDKQRRPCTCYYSFDKEISMVYILRCFLGAQKNFDFTLSIERRYSRNFLVEERELSTTRFQSRNWKKKQLYA